MKTIQFFCLTLLLLGLSSGVKAADIAEGTSEKVNEQNVLLLSLAYQAPLSLDKNVPLGAGFSYTREYLIGANTALGIHAGARIFPEPPTHYALGYGLSIKHYVFKHRRFQFGGTYLLYGLLVQMNFLSDRSGTAVGHDTRLTIGYDWIGDWAPSVELGYHFTQVRNFEEPTINWGYVETALGLHF